MEPKQVLSLQDSRIMTAKWSIHTSQLPNWSLTTGYSLMSYQDILFYGGGLTHLWGVQLAYSIASLTEWLCIVVVIQFRKAWHKATTK